MRKHVDILAVLYIVSSILFLLVSGAFLVVFLGLVNLTGEPFVIGISRTAAGVIALLLLALAAAGIVVGIGLHRRARWARLVTIIISVINLFNFPIGTLIGAYALVVMLHPDTVQLFAEERDRPREVKTE